MQPIAIQPEERMSDRPATRSGLERCRVGDVEVVTIDGSLHLALELREAAVLVDLDGSHTVGELETLHGGAAVGLVADLHEAGFLVGSDPFEEPPVVISGFGLEFSGFDRVVAGIDRLAGRALSSRLMQIAAIAVLVMGPFVAAAGSPGDERFSGSFTLAGLVAWGLVSVFGHELAHALVLHRAGRRIGRAGFGLHWGALTFFVDATDALFLPRPRRIGQALAGPAADATIAGALALAAAATAPSPTSVLLAQMATLGYISALVNLSPVLELDGQHILADLFDVPDLHRTSFDALRRLIRQRRRDALPMALYALTAITIGVTAIAFSVHLWATNYLPVLVTTWNEGLPGKTIALAFAGPTIAALLATTIHTVRRIRTEPIARRG